jgi:predicted O-methyltransferase YrrM
MTPFDAPSEPFEFVDGDWPTRPHIAPYAQRVWDEYIDYGRIVTKRGMAINVWAAGLLWWACDQVKAKAVCDLGSGFTSYIAARYAADNPGVTVASVDDEVHWLGRTEMFLRRHRQSTAGLMHWSGWQASTDTYDVIVHDFNCGETRNATMWTAAERLNPGGILIFDDAHHHLHHAEMRKVCEAHDWVLVPLYEATRDETERFAAIAVTRR